MHEASAITALLGPTSTGKTHRAVERMLEHPTGMSGLPLRLLAREVLRELVPTARHVDHPRRVLEAHARRVHAAVAPAAEEHGRRLLDASRLRGRSGTSRRSCARSTGRTWCGGGDRRLEHG